MKSFLDRFSRQLSSAGLWRPSSSLRYLARKDLTPAAKGPRWHWRLREATRRGIESPWSTLILLSITASLAILKPNIPGFSILCRTLSVLCIPELSRELLLTLWQVIAATLALAIAATLFAFESFLRSHPGVTQGDLVTRSGLLGLVMIGAASLSSIGLVLFWNTGRPPVAAAACALTLGALTLFHLPFFVRNALVRLDPKWFYTTRRSELALAISNEVSERAFAARADALLYEWTTRNPDVEIMSLNPGDHIPIDTATTTGTIFDLDLKKLEQASEYGRVYVHRTLGAPVNVGTVIVSLEPKDDRSNVQTRNQRDEANEDDLEGHQDDAAAGESQRDGKAAEAGEHAAEVKEQQGTDESTEADTQSKERPEIKIAPVVPGRHGTGARPNREAKLDRLTSSLRTEAIASIRAGSIAVYEHVLETYSFALKTWMDASGPPASRNLRVRPWDQFSVASAPRRLLRDLLVQMETIVETGSREKAALLLGVLGDPTARALKHRDLELLKLFDETTRCFVQAAVSSPHILQVALDSVEGLFFVDWQRDLLKDLDLEESRLRVHRHAAQIRFDEIANLLRYFLEQRLDEEFERFEQRFSGLLKYWPTRPSLVHRPDELARASALNGLRDELRSVILGLRFSIFVWMVESGLTSPTSTRLPVAISFSERLDLRRTFSTLITTAVPAVLAADGKVSRWQMQRAPWSQTVNLDPETPTIRAIALLALRYHTLFPPLPVCEWLSSRRVELLREEMESLVGDQQVRERWCHPSDDFEGVVNRVLQTLQQALDRKQEQERLELLAAELDPARLREFEQALQAGWAESSFAKEMLQLGQVEPCTSVNLAASRQAIFRVTGVVKSTFTSGGSEAGARFFGRDLGSRIAKHEGNLLLRKIHAKAKRIKPKCGSASDRVLRMLDELRSSSFEPTLIVIPDNWYLMSRLKLPIGDALRQPDGPLAHRHRGEFDGIPVVSWFGGPQNLVLAADLPAFCKLNIAVKDPEGVRLAPSVAVRETIPSPADEIAAVELATVDIEIRNSFEVEVLDDDAARSAWLPPSTRNRPAPSSKLHSQGAS